MKNKRLMCLTLALLLAVCATAYGEPGATANERTAAEEETFDALIVSKTAEWSEELGFYGLWPLEKKAEFYDAYGSLPHDYNAVENNCSLPNEDDVTLEDALAQCKELLKSKYELPDEQIEAYQVGVEFNTDGSYAGFTGSERTMMLSFYREKPDSPQGYFPDFFAYVSSPGGDVYIIRNPDEEEIMSWGIGENAAWMLTEVGWVYYNPDGGQYFHLDPNCPTMDPKYWAALEKVETGLLRTTKYHFLKQCPICLPAG